MDEKLCVCVCVCDILCGFESTELQKLLYMVASNTLSNTRSLDNFVVFWVE